jgi:hypothetical protein
MLHVREIVILYSTIMNYITLIVAALGTFVSYTSASEAKPARRSVASTLSIIPHSDRHFIPVGTWYPNA